MTNEDDNSITAGRENTAPAAAAGRADTDSISMSEGTEADHAVLTRREEKERIPGTSLSDTMWQGSSRAKYLGALVRELIGNAQRNKIAEEAGISLSNLSRIINAKNPTPPKKKTLEKLYAVNPNSRVRLNDLFSACNYPEDPEQDPGLKFNENDPMAVDNLLRIVESRGIRSSLNALNVFSQWLVNSGEKKFTINYDDGNISALVNERTIKAVPLIPNGRHSVDILIEAVRTYNKLINVEGQNAADVCFITDIESLYEQVSASFENVPVIIFSADGNYVTRCNRNR